jgi:hypothetical protein
MKYLKRKGCVSVYYISKWYFGHRTILRNHEFVARAVIVGTHKLKKYCWLVFRGWPFGGQEDLNKWFSQPSRTNGLHIINYHVNRISVSRDNGDQTSSVNQTSYLHATIPPSSGHLPIFLENGEKIFFFLIQMEFKRTCISFFHIQEARYWLHLHVKPFPYELYVGILNFYFPNKCSEMVLWKAVIFDS